MWWPWKKKKPKKKKHPTLRDMDAWFKRREERHRTVGEQRIAEEQHRRVAERNKIGEEIRKIGEERDRVVEEANQMVEEIDMPEVPTGLPPVQRRHNEFSWRGVYNSDLSPSVDPDRVEDTLCDPLWVDERSRPVSIVNPDHKDKEPEEKPVEVDLTQKRSIEK